MSFTGTIPANTNQVKNLLSTSVVKGCVVTVNSGNNKKFDISKGIVRFVDNTTNPQLPNFKEKVFPGLTGGDILTEFTSTKVIIENDLTVTTEGFVDLDTNTQTRTRILLDVLIHFGDNPIVFVAPALSNLGVDKDLLLSDLMKAVGHIRKKGLKISPNGANLSFNISTGIEFSQFFPKRVSSPKDPTTGTPSDKSPASFFHSWRDGAGGWNVDSTLTTFINVDAFDDNTGGSSQPNGVIGPAKAGIWRVYEINESVGILHPQQFYNGLTDALDNLPTEIFEQSTFFQATSFRGHIIALGASAELDNTAQALFLDPDGDFVETRL